MGGGSGSGTVGSVQPSPCTSIKQCVVDKGSSDNGGISVHSDCSDNGSNAVYSDCSDSGSSAVYSAVIIV